MTYARGCEETRYLSGTEAEVLAVADDSPCSAARRAASFCLRFCFFLLTVPSAEPFVGFVWTEVPFDAGWDDAVTVGLCVDEAMWGVLCVMVKVEMELCGEKLASYQSSGATDICGCEQKWVNKVGVVRKPLYKVPA